MKTHLVWLRNDLRIHDNYALHAACRDEGAKVIALFIATPGQWRRHGMAPMQARFLWHSLQDVQASLAEKGIALYQENAVDYTASVTTLAAFCQAHCVDRLFYNYQYEINERDRDVQAERLLYQAGIDVQGFDDSVLFAPGTILTSSQSMYKVFTPFSTAVVSKLQQELPACVKAPAARPGAPLQQIPRLQPFDYADQAYDENMFPAGEQAALRRLRQFCQTALAAYPDQRDIPAQDGTSRLSVYLTLGVLSPRQCLHRVLAESPRALEGERAFIWLNEIIWREFYRHLLVAWPDLCKHQPFIGWTRHIRWQENAHYLQAWRDGQTGYPIVDAAMRQLKTLGWMHNRLRMISASFLVKDLLLDWREGERHFMHHLIDGDLAANNGGWQWAASTGTDAAPYFRIFNPTTQGERFDPSGDFIRRWLPELKDVPDNAIHQPHEWAKKNQQKLAYPSPIVEHKAVRKLTLAAFEAAKNQQEE
ncbi:deoxyribodipyrimidine photo-lyase [Erwinia sp. OLTSP20]|uniref:deoxyribodipyrimidine photo-lyase n=1 Tax=unclassified Erwinia TaxID=2622719 RepID=UPI000C17AB2B|nr:MULTISPECIES: deoxyribodipyrimidine photo-lyase [unclassified Erwinia]PIJ48769.1 deoxyribodipyrimidine photo-lyase [Erwinia sp. OAMSP11]PIJ69393.1 deoxyribodipyrimidine photo-lyase [Erwinia sp. OLSSP12]PIJ79227.1 deoxyribodipyrimidine photo-lyase [Erwinia sp. OLCASP19]PIJ80753.1 deoxyribodipyrimidine photo-lyase [Erwinia sp. OLMTSP26]PIJ82904.1 deoxyribodipyrimidine photo-lyase [Erwinia sp. OLMDSP33]